MDYEFRFYTGSAMEALHVTAVETDSEALEAFQTLTRLEGIIPALEPSHALAEVIKRAPKMGKDEIILMNLSGRGDKDIFTVAKLLGM